MDSEVQELIQYQKEMREVPSEIIFNVYVVILHKSFLLRTNSNHSYSYPDFGFWRQKVFEVFLKVSFEPIINYVSLFEPAEVFFTAISHSQCLLNQLKQNQASK